MGSTQSYPAHHGHTTEDIGPFKGARVYSDKYVSGVEDMAKHARPYSDALNVSAMSGLNPSYWPHGIDPNQLKPMPYDPSNMGMDMIHAPPIDGIAFAEALITTDHPLTSNRFQWKDLRAPPAIGGMSIVPGTNGAFGGAYESTAGPYEYQKPVRTWGNAGS